MGYFPNGTSGDIYYEMYCSKCVHEDTEREAAMCPIWLWHMVDNYKECNNEKSYLHKVIPRSKDDLDNEQCVMFLERSSSIADQALPPPSTAARVKSMEHLRAIMAKEKPGSVRG